MKFTLTETRHVPTRKQKERKPRSSRIQASDAMYMRTGLFLDFTQRRMSVPYRRFGPTYRFHLQGSSLTEPVMQTKFIIKPHHN